MNQWGMFALGILVTLLACTIVMGIYEGTWWALYDYYAEVFGPLVKPVINALRRKSPRKSEGTP